MALSMNTLQSQETKGELKEALYNLAKGKNKLDEAYRGTMERVQSQEESPRRLAMQTLAWIFHAKRPLSTEELLHALAVRRTTSMLDENYIPKVGRLLSVCAGLVRLDEKSKIIDLIHKTTRDYFEITKDTWFPDAESDITTICTIYLSFSVFGSGFCQTDAEFEERLQSNQLYKYAAQNWGHHARKASTLCQEGIDFLECEAKVQASSQALLANKRWSGHSSYSQEFPRQMTELHLTAYFGVEKAIGILLKKGSKANSKDSYGRTPLSWAAASGHEAVVKLLLEKDATVETVDSEYGQTPLSWAAESGHEAVVKLLLEKDADIDAEDNLGWTALQLAAFNRHIQVERLLVLNGASEPDDFYGLEVLFSIE